jgi:Zn-dependent protease with chaperone function
MKFKCTHCAQTLEAEEDYTGQTIECPTCKKTFTVAAPSAAAAPRDTKEMSTLGSNLMAPGESTYFAIALVISCLVWLACVVAIFPILIIVALGLMVWLGNGLLVAQLKADAVKVEGYQMPELAGSFARACAKLQVKVVPDLYVLQSGGLLNAFATRFSGRHFVVVYSELLDTYGPDSAEIEFLLGHELGHIKRSHILKHIFLAPGLLFPLLGNAYSRACEASCDRHGLFASSRSQGAINAMLILAAGKQARSTLSPALFAAQYANNRGFFVSWYELISGYPTLSQRVSNMLALSEGRPVLKASRNPFAYLFAFFTLGGRSTGGGNIMITVATIGLLAAIAIPSFVKARETAQASACVSNMRLIDAAKEQAALENEYAADADVPEENLSNYIERGFGSLVCTKGGRYTVNPVGQDPECSVHGTLSDAMERATAQRQRRR